MSIFGFLKKKIEPLEVIDPPKTQENIQMNLGPIFQSALKALIPSMAQVALSKAIPAAIDLAEDLFPKRNENDRRGQEKKAFVMDMVRANYGTLRTHKKIPDAVVEREDQLFGALNFLVDQVVLEKKSIKLDDPVLEVELGEGPAQ